MNISVRVSWPRGFPPVLLKETLPRRNFTTIWEVLRKLVFHMLFDRERLDAVLRMLKLLLLGLGLESFPQVVKMSHLWNLTKYYEILKNIVKSWEILWLYYSGFILDLFRISSGFIQDLFRIYGIYSGFIQNLFRICTGFFQDLYRIYSGFIQDLFRIYWSLLENVLLIKLVKMSYLCKLIKMSYLLNGIFFKTLSRTFVLLPYTGKCPAYGNW